MKIKPEIAIAFFSVLLFIPFLGSVHLFDWDEINFAESAREMLLTQNWFQVQINFQAFWEKPPLFFWMQAASMKIFGVNEFAARLPNALCGILTLQVLYAIGKRRFDPQFAMTWVLLYAGSFLPHLYFKSGIIDPWFNLFIFLSVYQVLQVFETAKSKQGKHALLAGLFTGLAILTKGPVALLILALTVLAWLAWNRFKTKIPWGSVGLFAITALLVSSLWFAYETLTNGPAFLLKFIAYQVDLFMRPVAGHKQAFYYHFLVVLLGCFPLSVIALPAFSRNFISRDKLLSRWMKQLFWVVMLLFTLVSTKIVHYSSLAYLPLSYLAASVIQQQVQSNNTMPLWQRSWILAQGLVISIALVLVPLAIALKDLWLPKINISDPFIAGNLSVHVAGTGWEWIPGVVYGSLMVAVFVLLRKNLKAGIRLLALGTAAVIFAAMALVVPMIEPMSQGAAIKFFKDNAGKDVYFETFGYKSYAHYFYGEITPATAHSMDKNTLRTDAKPVMVSCKANHVKKFEETYPQAKLLYEAGGFAFYVL